MPNVELSDKVERVMRHIEGDNLDQKVLKLLLSDLKVQLKECEDEIYGYEVTYGMSFAAFKKAWKAGKIDNPYSHPVERDYMSWEGLEAERAKLLSLIADVRNLG